MKSWKGRWEHQVGGMSGQSGPRGTPVRPNGWAWWLGLLASSASSSAVHIPCCPGGSPSAGTVSGITLGASVLRVALGQFPSSFHLLPRLMGLRGGALSCPMLPEHQDYQTVWDLAVCLFRCFCFQHHQSVNSILTLLQDTI